MFVFLQIVAVTFAGKKTLVLVDNWSIRETHSVFFKSLRGELLDGTVNFSHKSETMNDEKA